MWYPWPWGQQVASTVCSYILEHLCQQWQGEHDGSHPFAAGLWIRVLGILIHQLYLTSITHCFPLRKLCP